jgi:hypothetical protein
MASFVFSPTVKYNPEDWADPVAKPSFTGDVKRGYGQLVSGIGSTLQDVGAPGIGRSLEAYGTEIAERYPSQIQSFSDVLSNPLTTVREATGEMVPQVAGVAGGAFLGARIGAGLGAFTGPLAPIAVPTLAAAGGVIGGLATTGAQTYGGIRQEQREQGIDDKGRALLATVPAVALERLGVEKIAGDIASKGLKSVTRKAEDAGQSFLGYVGRQAIKGGITEGPLTEIPQTALERFGAYKDTLSDEAFNEYGVAGAKGFAGGAVFSGGLAAVRPRGADLLQGQPMQDAETEIEPPAATPLGLERQLPLFSDEQAPVELAPASQIINPYNVGGFVGAQQQGLDTTMQIGEQTGQLELDAAGPRETVEPSIQKATGPVTQEEYDAVATKYGLTPVEGATNRFDLAGRRFYSKESLDKFVSDLAVIERDKSDFRKSLDQIVLAKGGLSVGDKTTASALNKQIEGKLNKLQIREAATATDAADILNDQIDRLGQSGKTITDKNVSELASFYEAITGQVAPAYQKIEEVRTKLKATVTPSVTATQTAAQTAAQPGAQTLGLVTNQGAPSGRPDPTAPGAVTVTTYPEGQRPLDTAPTVQPEAAGQPQQVSGAPQQQQQAVTEQADAAARQAWEDMDVSGIDYDILTDQDKQAWSTAVTESKATGEAQEQLAEVYKLAAEEEFAQQVLERTMLKLAPKSPAKAQFFADFLGDKKQSSNEELANRYNVSVETIKDWTSQLNKNLADTDRLRQAFAATTVEMRLNPTEIQTTLQDIAQRAAEANQQLQQTTQPDEVKLDEAELANVEGSISTSDRKSASLQEVNKAEETRNAKFIRLSKAIEEAENEGNAARVEELNTELETLLEQMNKQAAKTVRAAKETKKAKEPKGAVQKRETKKLSVQPKAGAGEKVGGQVRGAEKPAQESQAKTEAKGEVALKAATVDFNLNRRSGIASNESVIAGLRKIGEDDDIALENPSRVGSVLISGIDRQRDGQKGRATELLQSITSWADKNNFPLVLVPAASKVENGLDNQQLEAWYTRNGFRKQADGAMVRAPKAETIQTTEEATQAAYEKLVGMLPEGTAPAWNSLTVAQKEALMSVSAEELNMRNLQRVADESNVIDVEARVIPEQEQRLLLENTSKLSEPDIAKLEKHYGFARGTKEFIQKLHADVTTLVNRGAEFVADNIRSIVQQVAKAVIAAAVVFNPNITGNGFDFSLKDAYANIRATQQQETVPADVIEQMSEDARIAYQQLAPLAKNKNRGFIIADKKNGKIHMFYSSGQHLASDTALFGKDIGDKFEGDSLKGGRKITPAGKFTLKATEDAEYAGGWRFDLQETLMGDGVIAIHPAWLGDVKEKRLERLASPDAKDNRISYGCINTSHDTFLQKLKPNLNEFDGGMIFVLPENGFTSLASINSANAETVYKAQKLKFNAIRDEKAVDNAFVQFEAAGISDIFKLVDEFQLVKENGYDAAGVYFVKPNGDTVVGFTEETLTEGTNFTTHTIRHEMGHVVDDPSRGGIYSSNASLGISKQNGKWIGTGAVSRELINLYNTDPNWNSFLSYPLEANYGVDETRAEMFAQMFSAYLDPAMKAALYDKAPNAAKFMEEVIKHVKSTTAVRIKENNERKKQTKQDGVRQERQGVRQEQISPRVYSVKAGRQKANINKLPPSIRPQNELLINTLEVLGKVVPTFAFTSDLADIGSRLMPSVKKYLGYAQEQAVTTQALEQKVRRILDSFDALPAAVKGTGPNSVNKFLKDSTMSGKWGYKIKQDSAVVPDPDLERRFNAFPPEAQKLIKDVFTHGYETLQLMKKTVRENITTQYDALIVEAQKANDLAGVAKLQAAKDSSLKDYNKLLSIAGNKPYAPLKRFGNYVVVGKSTRLIDAEKNNDAAEIRKLKQDPAHYYVAFAETKGEGQTIANSIKGTYDQVSDVFEKAADETLYGGSDMNQVFARIRNLVDEVGDSKASAATTNALKKLVNDLHTQMLGQQSAMHATNRRLGVAGADDDMMRSFATQGRATAHFIGAVSNTERIYESLRAMKKEAGQNAEARKYYNEFVRRHGMGYDYDPSPILNKALATTSFMMLLTSPAYYLQNLTQPFMLSVPYMAGEFGYARTQAELLSKAYPETFALLKNISLGQQLEFNKLPADVREAIQDMVNRGVIDISLEQDLGRWESSSDNTVQNLGKVTNVLQSVAQKAEMVNRIATAITAYRLAKSANRSEGDARDYAAKVIRVTHGDYSGANAPRFMRKGVGRLITQFRKFQLIQISMMARLFNDATRGSTPEVKRAARRALLFTFGHAGAVGGIIGLPGFQVIAAIWGALFGDEDEPFDAEREVREYFGEDVGLLMTRGIPANFGVDLSEKLGMGQMLSILPYADIDLSKQGWEKTVTAAMGPFIGGLVPRAIGGVEHIQNGNYYKGIEQLMPKGVTDAMKAYRLSTEGVTQKNNDVTLSPDELSSLQIFMTALGLPSTKLTEQQFDVGSKIEAEKFFDERTTKLKRKYAKAYRDNDRATMQEARDEWKSLQDSRVSMGFSRQPISNLLRSPQEQRKRERETRGGVQFTRETRGFVQDITEEENE